MTDLIEYIEPHIYDFEDEWHFKSHNNQYAPVIKEGDIVYIEKIQSDNFVDGGVYVFLHKDNISRLIIRKVSFTLTDNILNFSTPSVSEAINSKDFLKSYKCVGRVTQSVQIDVKTF